MKLLAGFWLGMMAVLLVGAAYQLSPVDVEQNTRLATIESYLFATPDKGDDWTPEPFFDTPTPESTQGAVRTPPPTIARVATVTPSATLLPMTYAGNVSGVSLWVRECPALNCDILARVYPGEWVAVNRALTKVEGNHEWVALWNHTDGAIGGWVAMRQISPAVRLLAFRP